MNTPPSTIDVSPAELANLLTRHWGIPNAQLTYLPLGFGSHHWRAEGTGPEPQIVFVTVDDVRRRPEGAESLRRAMTTAWHLANHSGIEAVVAPIAGGTGDLVVMLSAGWTVTVFPHFPAEPSNWGEFATEPDRIQAQQLMAQVHGVAPITLPPGVPSPETFAIQCRADLFARIGDLSAPWTSGPYGESTRALLQAHRDQILAGFARYDSLVRDADAGRDAWVVTHGEPHAGNIVRRADTGKLVIVDWDTCALAPRERDLWQLFPTDDRSLSSLDAYLQAADLPVAAISPDRLDLYRLRWDLEEIAIYSDWYHQPHEETEDMRTGWDGLQSSVALLAGHLERA